MLEPLNKSQLFEATVPRELLILERTNELDVKTSGKEYILEGIFAEFGVENNNKRIYHEKEYLPHLEYLQDKITKRALVGELDHPQKFEVEYKNVSHIVEKLWYDKSNRKVYGRIRILDTPCGEIVKRLIDNGVRVCISSRAAGVVKEDKSVEIKRIFTYDIVVDPGFQNAELKLVNESFGFTSEVDNIAIYDVTGKFPEIFENLGTKLEQNKSKNKSIKMSNTQPEYATVNELESYSVIVKTEIKKLANKLKMLESKGVSPRKVKLLENEMQNLRKTNYLLSDRLGKLTAYADYLRSEAQNEANYNSYLAVTVDQGLEYTKHIANHVQENATNISKTNKKVKAVSAYGEYLKENVETLSDYADYLGTGLNVTTNYVNNEVRDVLESNVAYSNYLGKKLDNIFENSSMVNSYLPYLAESVDQSIAYGEHIVESVQGVSSETPRIIETYKNLSLNDLDLKVNSILESVKKQKVDSVAKTNQYHFFKFLSEGKRSDFLDLDETKKQKVIQALNRNQYYSQNEVLKIWENALQEHADTDKKWIVEMPVEYRNVWNSLNENEKTEFYKKSKMFNLNTPYQIKSFWDGSGLRSRINENLNEGITHSVIDISSVPTSTLSLGYSNNIIKNVGAVLKSKKN